MLLLINIFIYNMDIFTLIFTYLKKNCQKCSYYLNPASYSSQDTISFIFDFGITSDFKTIKSSDASENTTYINIDHLAISFPVTRNWKTSVGIVPYSKVGYNLVIDDEEDEGSGDYNILYNGEGGINQFYFGNSILIGNHIALGINISYLFGLIERSKTIQLSDHTYQAYTYFNDKVDIQVYNVLTKKIKREIDKKGKVIWKRG